MKQKLLSIGVFVLLGFSTAVKAQSLINQVSKKPTSLSVEKSKIPTVTFAQPDMESIHVEDEERDRKGILYRIGVVMPTLITPNNAGAWRTLSNGDRVWEVNIKSEGAEALSFLFSTFKLHGGATIDVLDANGNKLHKTYTAKDNLDHGQQNLALCFGDEMIIRVYEPKGTTPSELVMDELIYNYRSTGNPNVAKINESDNCQVNVKCSPEGDNWQDEMRGVARIYVVEGASAGWCTGSLVNNTALNCRPYFLTAFHCGLTASAANFNNWKFYFGYQSPNCSNPGVAGTLDDYFITGCVKIADSNDGGGDTGSDFLLVQLGSLASEAATISTLKSANFNAYWNGWDANNTTSNAGTSIHHPSGDIKKISTYTTNLVSSTYGGTSGTHWRVTWASTTNGWGVTEPGSSGSPIFKYNGGSSRLMGTLTGGLSYCTATTDPDVYGKMSYHWQSNGGTAATQLKPHLDPGNTGALVIDGSSDPCSMPAVPVANFLGTPTTVNVGSNVNFTDLTSGVPNAWTWTISPGSAGVEWQYVSATTSSSQHPVVQFNTPGLYTISLLASNGSGSDTETKVDYIQVVTPTDPCAATSSSCDEYISNVTLGTINNTTVCTNYGDYTAQSTTLEKGLAYTVQMIPAIGGSPGAYTDDEMAIWIDYNNDLDFDDAGERIAYALVSGSVPTTFNFTVPLTATATGPVHMRCRISYQPDDGAITPCGTSTWGEVEDYTVILQDPFVSTVSLSCPGNQTALASTTGEIVPNYTGMATASTDCPGGVVNVTQSPTAGSTFVNGANVITITATDNCGTTEQCTFTVTYTDDSNLSLSCGSDFTQNFTTGGNQVPDVTAMATASSACLGNVVNLTQSPLAGSTLSEGTNVITVTATDQCGNTSNCTTTITYVYDVVLSVSCPGDQLASSTTTGPQVPDFTGSVTASSNCPGNNVYLAQSPTAGSSYVVGANVITITATDDCGSLETCTFTVTYTDDAMISLSCPADFTVPASGGNDQVPNIVAMTTSSTTCWTGPVVVTQDPVAGSTMSFGLNTITVTATDDCGNMETCTTVVMYDNDLGLSVDTQVSDTKIYPNPAQSHVFVDLTAVQENVTIYIFDVTGKLIKEISDRKAELVQIDMTNLAKGMYHISLMKDGVPVVKQISKQ